MDLIKLYQDINEMREMHFEMLSKTTALMNDLGNVIQLLQEAQQKQEEIEAELAK